MYIMAMSTAIDTVKNILSDSSQDEKQLLESLYNLILSQENVTVPRNGKFQQALEDLIANKKLESSETKHLEILIVNKTNISSLLKYDCDLISKFFCWVYERHYGWTEKLANSDEMQELSVDVSNEQNIFHILENIIAWIENHDHLSYNLLFAYKCVITSSHSLAVVRKQSILSFFRWIKNLSCKCVIVVWKCFLVLKDIIVNGLTDVWSAIRKDTASNLSIAVDLLDEEMFESLFMTLIKICNAGEPWQAAEGSVRGIDKILASCKLMTFVKNAKKKTNHSYKFKLGKMYFTTLPRFMTDHLEKVFFKLFGHQQLSVREVAGKAFASYLYKSEYKHFVESFEKIISYLKANFAVKNNEGITQFMNPYEAEGFLNAVLFLIKNVPFTHIASAWMDYWSVFSHYLMHHASTVRQTTSLLFKYILARYQTSLCFLKLVLQSLCAEWKTNLDKLTQPIKTNNSGVKERLSVTKKKEKHDISICWEWREGRLLAYEVVFRYLITNNTYFLVSKSHILEPKEKRSKTILNNSITEGQFFANGLGLQKQHSLLSQKHTLQKRKLAKSLTLSNLDLKTEELRKSIENEENQSLIEKAKKEEKTTQSAFLVDVTPSITLTKYTDDSQATPGEEESKSVDDQKIITWLSQQNYTSFRDLIKQVLIQTIESLKDQRWELRRMSQQLLLCMCDVIRLYDYGLLECLYVEAFKYPDSTLYFGACSCLLNITKSYLKIKKALCDSPNKYCDGKMKMMKDFITQYERNVDHYFTTLSRLLFTCQHKETCNVTMQCLVLYQLYISNNNDIDGIICSYFQRLYLSTQESSSVITSPQKKSDKHMLDLLQKLQSHLQEYCEKTDPIFTVLLLPTLVQAVYLSISDSLDINIMLNCVEIILQTIKTADLAPNYQTVLNSTCTEICHVIEKNDLEAINLQQACNVIILLRDIHRNHFPITIIEASVRRRKDLAMSEMQNKLADTPRPRGRNDKGGSFSEDRLSFSTASFDSARCLTDSDSGSDSDREKKPGGEEGDDFSSDWDWSSGDEDDKDEVMVVEVLRNLQDMLDRTYPPNKSPNDLL